LEQIVWIYREIKIVYMKNLIAFESINEAATALPAMPAFLKAAGAKPDHVQYGGPRMDNPQPNAWVVSTKSPDQKETWEIVFFPAGTFSTSAGSTRGAFLRSGGKWKANSAANFRFGSKTIKGVDMAFTTYMVLNPPS
jgi:hypothetical protein